MGALLGQASVLGWPDDPARWVALAAALPAAWLLPRGLEMPRARRMVVPLCAFVAALLSAAYVVGVLRGGPRIIDATSYWLQARALADGYLSFPIGEPEQSVLGRFLVRTDAPTTLADGILGLFGLVPADALAGQRGAAASVIFPPGYPALLATGFALGMPLAVGPVLAAAIVFATASLGAAVERSLATGGGLGPRADRHGTGATVRLAHVAALFSVLSATMRYHTADTMSHGLAALCFTVGLTAALVGCAHARNAAAAAGASSAPAPVPAAQSTARHASAVRGLRPQLGAALIAGLAIGWLFATRPVSAAALGACCLACVLGRGGLRAPADERSGGARTLSARVIVIAAVALGTFPGVVLWLAHQRAATGSPWGNAQALYYALSDGPEGCFRYGFGRCIGCVGEHGTFVGHNLPSGYGLGAALATSARRLQHHLGDLLNFSPAFLLVPLGAWLGRRAHAVRCLAIGALLQLVAYAPFYFDGNYPGGGARLLVDVLPVEHVLAAVAIAAIAQHAPRGRPSPRGILGGVAALALAGFALEAGADHAQLRDREGGRPMYEPGVVGGLGRRDLVLVDTDHGLNLGLEPGRVGTERANQRAPFVRRYRADGHDRLAWEALGRPVAYRYRFGQPPAPEASRSLSAPSGASRPTALGWLEPIAFDPRATAELLLRLEGEALWPARLQQGAWAWPVRAGGQGASGDGWLRVRAAPPERCPPAIAGAKVRIALPSAGELAGRPLGARARAVRREDRARTERPVELVLLADGAALHTWSLESDGWTLLEPYLLPTGPAAFALEVRVTDEAQIDWLEAGPRDEPTEGGPTLREAEGHKRDER